MNRLKYEDSLKHYRDMENSLDLQYAVGRKEEKLEIVQKAIQKGFDNQTIVDLTGLSVEQIEAVRKKK
jgi:hypothetical protein